MKTRLVLELPSDVHAIERAVERVLEKCKRCSQLPPPLRTKLRVSLSEALSNAVLYGNGRDPGKRVHLDVEVDPDRLTAQVTDEGDGFDPDTIPDPRLPENRHALRGRGLFLMRKLMDEVHYNDRGNSVTLVMRLNRRTGEVANGARR